MHISEKAQTQGGHFQHDLAVTVVNGLKRCKQPLCVVPCDPCELITKMINPCHRENIFDFSSVQVFKYYDQLQYVKRSLQV